MYFGFTDDQVELADALSEVLTDLCPPDVVRREWATPGSALTDLWKGLGQLGIFGLLQPTSTGGMGGSQIDMVLMLERCGRFALPGPIVEQISVVVPAACGGQAPRELIDSLTTGGLIATASEPGCTGTRWAAQSDVVLMPHDSGWFVSRERDHRSALARTSVDHSITETVIARDIGSELCNRDLFDVTVNNASLAVSAQLVGLASAMIEMTTAYVRQRKQFGTPVGAQQAVKHRLADALIAVEHARPVVYNAAYQMSVGAALAARDVSHARFTAAHAADLASSAALQCHGAIGYTWEHDLHMWFKRALALTNSWGSVRDHLDIVMTSVVGAKSPQT